MVTATLDRSIQGLPVVVEAIGGLISDRAVKRATVHKSSTDLVLAGRLPVERHRAPAGSVPSPSHSRSTRGILTLHPNCADLPASAGPLRRFRLRGD